MLRLLGACVALATVACAENLHPERIHLIDSVGQNHLFRGNMPRNDTSFAYDEIMATMSDRLVSAGRDPLPENAFLHVISFNNPFEMKDINYELTFCRYYPHVCQVTIWLLVGNPVSPSSVMPALRKDIAKEVVSIVDRLPQRTAELRGMLEKQSDRPHVFYMHCEAGCDRTGEFTGAYRIHNLNSTMADAWTANVKECGRPPNKFSKGALEWFCVWANEYLGHSVGSCDI